MIAKNDIITLEIKAVSNEGCGIGRYSDETLKDFVIYVPHTAKGDVIKCRVLKVLKAYAFGKIEEIITPSEDRIEIDCKAFGKCGGCVYRHINYEAELILKKEAVEYAYKCSFGKDSGIKVAETEPSDATEGYRNKVQYPISEDGKCAFFAEKSHRIVKIENCPLQDRRFEKVVSEFENCIRNYGLSAYCEESGKGLLRHLYLRVGTETGDICAAIVANAQKLPCEKEIAERLLKAGAKSVYLNVNRENTNVILGKEYRLLAGEKFISDTLCGVKMHISPQSFYQVNKHQAEKIYEKAVKLANIGSESNVLDLYCGIGGIAMTAAKYAKEAVGVEIVPEAIADAKRIAEDNKISNVRFFVSDANRLSKVLKEADFTPDTVIVDPPRKGLDDETVNALLSLKPEKIVYISCNPMTQAKNIKKLTETGEYKFDTVYPYDMFPRTAHVETVVLLSRA